MVSELIDFNRFLNETLICYFHLKDLPAVVADINNHHVDSQCKMFTMGIISMLR